MFLHQYLCIYCILNLLIILLISINKLAKDLLKETTIASKGRYFVIAIEGDLVLSAPYSLKHKKCEKYMNRPGRSQGQ